MKQITANHPTQNLKSIYRFQGKKVYIKYENLNAGSDLINRMTSMGWTFKVGKNWIESTVPLDRDVIINGIQYDFNVLPEIDVENHLINFFHTILKQAGYSVFIQEIK